MYAYFNSFTINLSPEDALSASHSGDCEADVLALLDVDYIARQLDAIPDDAIRAELDGYGAWDDDELADDDANRKRILWMACCNIREDMYANKYKKYPH